MVSMRKGMRFGHQLVCVASAIIIIAMTSSASSDDGPVNTEEDGTRSYDQVCFVPPSERPSDEEKLLLFDISLPHLEIDMEYLTFPFGTCGVELYVYYESLYVDPAFNTTIQNTASHLGAFCDKTVVTGGQTNTNATSTPLRVRVLTSGAISPYDISVPLVPQSELTRVPNEWLRRGAGVVLHCQIDYLVAGDQTVLCKVPILQTVPHSEYNLNYTFQVNGCPSGKYGGQCEQICSCAEGVDCHSFNGACMCPTGLQGIQCDQRMPQLTSQKQQIYIPYGDRANLTCTTHGMSPTAFSWTKDGQTTALATSSRDAVVSYTPRPTVISASVVAFDTAVNGGYTCEVQDENGIVYRQHVNVTVIALPNPFLQVPQSYTALVGSNVTFTCVTKPEAGTVRWVKGPNQPFMNKAAEIMNRIGRYETHQVSPNVSQLRIYGAEFEDEDVYRCFVGYIFEAPDLSFVEATLTVQSDPEPECAFGDVIDVQAGEELTLRCFLRQAKPVPRLAWNVESRPAIPKPVTSTVPSQNNLSWDINTSMTFVPSPEDDGKTVSLTVVSAVWSGNREVRTSLNVTYPPIVTISPDPVTLTLGQGATVRCAARSNPMPTTYVWTLGHSNKPALSAGGNESTYSITKVTKEYDMSNLTCLVANAVGERQMTVLIRVTEQRSSTGLITGFSVSGALCIALLVLASFLIHRNRREINLWWAKRAGKNKDDKMYDVFISYKSGGCDEDFVVRSLIPRLEQDGYRICVHYRSFVPGRSIIDNIADAVHWSRKTVLLLSPSFLESEWCRYEFQAALSQMLHLQTDLIPVIYADLGPPESLSRDLQTILRTLSYITWPDQYGQNGAEEERFWKLLWQSLPKNPLGQEEQLPDNPPAGDDNAFEIDVGMDELMIL